MCQSRCDLVCVVGICVAELDCVHIVCLFWYVYACSYLHAQAAKWVREVVLAFRLVVVAFGSLCVSLRSLERWISLVYPSM